MKNTLALHESLNTQRLPTWAVCAICSLIEEGYDPFEANIMVAEIMQEIEQKKCA